MYRVANVVADLGSIPLEQFPKVIPPDRDPYYVADFSVAITIDSNLSFKVLYNGKEYGCVTAKFDRGLRVRLNDEVACQGELKKEEANVLPSHIFRY